MSVHASKWAWGQRCPNPTTKLVLMALADHANADGECWPTMGTVAELADCSSRTVSRSIDALGEAGLVRRVERRMQGGEFRGWLYQLALPTSGHPRPVDTSDQWTPVTSGQERPVVASGRVQWTPVSGQEPSVEPTAPPLPPSRGVVDNSRALGTNPRAVAERQAREDARARSEAQVVGTDEWEQAQREQAEYVARLVDEA